MPRSHGLSLAIGGPWALSPQAGLGAAPVFAAASVVVARAVAAIAEFAVGVSVPSVAFLCRWLSVAPTSDDPCPAAVEASAAPCPDSAEAFAAVAGISDRPLRFRNWALPGAPWAGDP